MKDTPKALHYVKLTERDLDTLTDCLILCAGLASKVKDSIETFASWGENYYQSLAMVLGHFIPDDKEFYELTKRLMEELCGRSI